MDLDCYMQAYLDNINEQGKGNYCLRKLKKKTVIFYCERSVYAHI